MHGGDTNSPGDGDDQQRPAETDRSHAKERNIPIHIHFAAATVEYFYEIDPDLTIIWAHAGMSEPPEVISPLMDKHPTLHADTSF